MNHLKTGNSYFGAASYIKYKFGGKELQETGMYDFGARIYMADIARWFAVDPMAEQNPGLTPYRYGFNNPVMFTDPNGMLEQALTDKMWALGGTWYNTGDGFENESNIKLGYEGNYLSLNTAMDSPSGGGGGSGGDTTGTILLPGIRLSGQHNQWGQAFQNAFNALMNSWNNMSSGWGNNAAMGTVGVLTLPTGGGASAGTWTAIRGVLGELAGGLRAGVWGLPLMLNGDISATSTKVFDVDITKRPGNNQLYLYRNMIANGSLPMLGQNRFTLGIRSLDIDGKTGSDYVYPSSLNGLSTTLGIGNKIPLNVPNKTDKTTLFRINAATLPAQGLIPAQIEGNYIRVIPGVRMTAHEFNLRIQLTAPLWTPIR